ncbi:MAG: exodeoxyribonuclease VII large subunit [Victivallaceae bacterium]|nr:exodeoxyribonuclease VII large subunit [Victivallaceae bacterium]
MPEGQLPEIWSVSEVNRVVRELVEGSLMPFWVGGEIGSLTLHGSGHAYFVLKDAKSQIKAVYFGGARKLRELGVTNGSAVELLGALTVYEVRGEYQLSVRTLRLAGLGDLQKQFEATKKKLAAEGLFDPARKKSIPLLPQRIGVVTSPAGAAIADFLKVIFRRFPNLWIRIYPALVQGAGAAAEVAAGVEFFNRTGGVDVIVVTRGGGSMEDLWCFNDETLARVVAASAIPVISAVGHEIDFTICDFAADLRCPTPSAAAEQLIGSRAEFSERIERSLRTLAQSVRIELGRQRLRTEKLAGLFTPGQLRRSAEMKMQHCDDLAMRLCRAMQLGIERRQNLLDRLGARLAAVNPEKVLRKGFALLRRTENGEVITSAAQPVGTGLTAQLADGEIALEVLDSSPKDSRG